MLHQACENLFVCTRLVYTLQSRKQHNLFRLLASVRKYSEGFRKIFPMRTDEDKRLFELLATAYVEARYNPQFVVTQKDLDILMIIVEQLIELLKDICEQQIRKYGEM